MENLEIVEDGSSLLITFVGSDEERKELNMEEVNNSLADLGIARELTQKEFYELYDNGEVVIELEEKNEGIETQNFEEQINTVKNESRNRFKYIGYNKGLDRKVIEVLADYFEDGYWITKSVVRMGMCAYRADFFVENRKLRVDYDKIYGPIDHKLLYKIVKDDINLDSSGVDNRECLYYSIENQKDGSLKAEFVVNMDSNELILKLKLETRDAFLRRYGMR